MDANSSRPSGLRLHVRIGALLGPLSATALFATAAQAESTECEDMSGVQKAQCERVMDCMALTDREVRRACIAAVERASGRAEPKSSPPRPAAPPPPAVVTTPQPAEQQSDRTLEERLEALEERLADTAGGEATDTGAYPPPPPPEFSGELTDIYGSVMDRRLLTLDDRYVFEVERAKRGRFKVGQTVEAKRANSLMGNRSWVLTGPVGASVQALRIRCEREELGRDDRRRCAGMLNR